ncbi:hypothetical protein FVA74_08440 [Salinibacterium sp. dk2585]|uniref:hypothetical protein n=1 Tax=unclassified Salinibacterium TaxID=2632331 RepID=UPI0011C251D1|nr:MULTISPECIES: hypothetical protein [unclassified Salinibacterium]QEE61602.1 hypothetical protein FVA74_08440 [Salinibacterium sp. dk2585]TXK52313.1 hypothetical protein FVP63_13315 [Salinibacterium sp. dk5596]
MTTFLESHLSDRDIRTAKAVNDFKSTHALNGPGTDPEFVASFNAILKAEMEPIAARLHASVSERVRVDPLLNLTSDEMTAELRATPRRGRRG